MSESETNYPLDDEDFYEATVTEVRGRAFAHGHGWWLSLPDDAPEPKVGDQVRLYGKGIGHTVRGVFLNGERVFYRTEEEEKARHEVDMYGASAADLLARWDAGGSVFSVEMGGLGPGYEQAIQITVFEILRHLLATEPDHAAWENDRERWQGDRAAIEAAVIPATNYLGLSGAQWGAALGLAIRLYARGPIKTLREVGEDRRIQVSRTFPSPVAASA